MFLSRQRSTGVFTYLTYLGGSSVDYIGGITGVGQYTSPTHALAVAGQLCGLHGTS